MRERLHFFIIKDCKKNMSSVLKQMLTRHIWYFTYISCLASQSCSRDGIFHCTSSTRPPDKWWGKPIGSSQWSTSAWPIQKLLSLLERPQLNQQVWSVFQRHVCLQKRIKDVIICLYCTFKSHLLIFSIKGLVSKWNHGFGFKTEWNPLTETIFKPFCFK